MKLVATHKSEQNEAAIDPWTAVHFSAGLALGLMGARLGWSFGVAVGYEVVEQVVERQAWGRRLFRTHRPESVANSVVDLAARAAGHRAGEWWNGTGGGA